MKTYKVRVDIRYNSGFKDQYDTQVAASRIDIAIKRAIHVRSGDRGAFRVDVTAYEIDLR